MVLDCTGRRACQTRQIIYAEYNFKSDLVHNTSSCHDNSFCVVHACGQEAFGSKVS